MLPVLRNQIGLLLSPSKVSILRRQKGFGRETDALLVRQVIDIEGGGYSVLNVARSLLARYEGDKAQVSVVLADSYVNFGILPWSADIKTSAEREQYARVVLRNVFGDLVDDWTLCLNEAIPLQPCVIGAIETDFLSEIRRMVEEMGHALKTVNPRLVVAYNGRRKQIPCDTAWFASFADGSLAALHLSDGVCDGVRSMRVTNNVEAELRRLRMLGKLAKNHPGLGNIYIDSAVSAHKSRVDEEGLVWIKEPPLASNFAGLLLATSATAAATGEDEICLAS